MKPQLHRLPSHAGASFNIAASENYHSYNEWHYHQELELLYVEKGEGTRFIGDQIEPILEGDLILIGPNTPHMFRFDTHAYENKLLQQGLITLHRKLLTLHFDPDVFGAQFMALPENMAIVTLFKTAASGLKFTGQCRAEAIKLMATLLEAENTDRLLLLMQLFSLLANSKEYAHIVSEKYSPVYNGLDETRLTKIYLYTLNNFTRNIKLKDIAAIVYMVPNAFCRYFKSRTKKSYFTFLLEVRVSHACKLLVQSDYSMVMVSFECGFTNVSNFNRHFKLITGKTPLAYRKKFI